MTNVDDALNIFFISVQALYRGSHDNFLQYLYLIAPISVAFLNPIGFLFMEIQKSRDSAGSENARSKWRTMGTVVYGVVTNPIVFMTVLGIIGNFAFKQKVPYVLDSILTVIGEWIDPFQNKFSPSGLQPEHCKLAHEL